VDKVRPKPGKIRLVESRKIAKEKSENSDDANALTAVWTGVTRDTRPISDIGGQEITAPPCAGRGCTLRGTSTSRSLFRPALSPRNLDKSVRWVEEK
jgi:hypothetical protein